jgi:hypothetical protein
MRKSAWVMAGVWVFISILLQGNSFAFISEYLDEDPLRLFVGQPQEEGANVYVLSIDVNGDGLNDVLIRTIALEKRDEEVTASWWIYLKDQGGYREVSHDIDFNTDYIAVEDMGTSGTRVITYYKDDKEDDEYGEYGAGDGHIYRLSLDQFVFNKGPKVNANSDTFKRLFADNYNQRIKTISQTDINKLYKIKVFPRGRRKDFYNGVLQYRDLPTLPRTDPNSDTTGTLLTYGIILGNYTTSETLQLQAQAGGTSQTLRAKGGKGGATGKDRKQTGPKVTPTPKASEKGKTPSSNGTPGPKPTEETAKGKPVRVSDPFVLRR